MSYLRYLLAPVLVCVTLLLTGALSSHTPLTAASAPGPRPSTPAEDPKADELLGQAVEMLKPERIAWLDAKIWQQVACEDFTYEADGTYLSAPGNRLRLQLNVLLGKTRSELQVVSDGTTLWQVMRVARGKPTINRTDLVAAPKDHDRARASARACALRSQGLMGIQPLLEDLRARMAVTRQEAIVWKTRNVKRLTLVWREAEAAKRTSPGQGWPANLPSRCRVYLDASTLWPHRIEWWSVGQKGQEKQIVQMELRNPVVNRPLTSRQCERQFAFDPGDEKGADGTGTSREAVQSGEIAAPAALASGQ